VVGAAGRLIRSAVGAGLWRLRGAVIPRCEPALGVPSDPRRRRVTLQNAWERSNDELWGGREKVSHQQPGSADRRGIEQGCGRRAHTASRKTIGYRLPEAIKYVKLFI
jgi:hypothetical protein